MGVAAVAHRHYMLPDTPYAMWVRDELADYLHLPKDGTRVEVIAGEIVVSPGPSLSHNLIVGDIQKSAAKAEFTDPEFPWECAHTTDLNLVRVCDGYIPDLVILRKDLADRLRHAEVRHLLPHHIDLVIEVTSSSNAADDREPGAKRLAPTKWNGYAYTGIPYYLLIDRDPRLAKVTLYAEPDVRTGTYRTLTTWDFGDTIQLPEPFNFEIPTTKWTPWHSES